MMQRYTYQATLAAAEKITWRVEDIIGGRNRLDFSKRFMPEALAGVESLTFLSGDERRILNQVRGYEYLILFGLVEEFILPFVMDHVRTRLGGDDYQTRAFLEFAGEEAKHIHLFREFRKEFEAGFPTRCDVIGPPEAVAKKILSHHPLAVALTILHIEWFTQKHFLESVQDDHDLDPLFKSLLKHHWMEEAQHAKLDTLMVETLARGRTPDEITRAFNEYLEIGMFLDQGLAQQIAFNLESFTRATGRVLSPDERQKAEAAQRKAVRWTYLGSGMTHPNFRDTVEMLDPALRRRLDEVAPAFC